MTQKMSSKKGSVISRRMTELVQPGAMEGGFGWAVCLAAAWCNGVTFGIVNTYSRFMVEIQKQFPDDADNLRAGAICSCLMGLLFALSPFASFLTDRVGIRVTCTVGSLVSFTAVMLSSFAQNFYHFLITWGVMLGFGLSLTFSPSLVLITKYFNRRLGLANALVSVLGSFLFTTMMPLYLDLFVPQFGFMKTLRILSSLPAVMVILCAFVYRVPKSCGQNSKMRDQNMRKMNNNGSKSSFCNKKLLDKNYILWVNAVALCDYGFSIMFAFVIQFYFIATKNHDKSTMIVIVSISAAFGRFATGIVSDHPKISRLRVQQCAMFIFGVTYIIAPNLHSKVAIAIVCIVLGFTNGANIVMLAPVCFELMGPKNTSQGLGFAFLFKSLFIILGPISAGVLFDITGELSVPFYIAGMIAVFASFLLCFASVERKKMNLKPQIEKSQEKRTDETDMKGEGSV